MVGLSRKEDRMSSYKKGIDSKDGRRRRDDTRVKLRKEKREEGLMKRRAMGPASTQEATTGIASTSAAAPSSGTNNEKKIYVVTDIPELLAGISNQAAGDDKTIESIRGFRRMLSVEHNPPCRSVIDSGALPFITQLLQRNGNRQVQFEAAWTLTNVASSEHTAVVVECGAVPSLVALLRSPDADVREQCAWCLGNIAGDSTELRDIVLEANALEGILLNIAQPANDSLLGNAVWTLSNFCRGKPQPKLDMVAPALPHLASLLHADKKEVLVDVAWALSYVSDGDDTRIQAVMDSGVTGKLIENLSNESATIVTPALRTLGNFVSGSDGQTQAVIDAGVMNHAASLLAHPRKNVRKETCWLLSNIAAGTQYQIAKLLSMPNEITAVIHAAQNDQWEIRKEATWVISNICSGGSQQNVQQLVELGAIDAICSVLDVADHKIATIALEAIEAILKTGEALGKAYISFVDECGGIDKIESLQEHENDDIYNKAIQIIEKYFGTDEGEDENLAPVVSGDTFSFGVPATKALDGHSMQQEPFNFSSENAPTLPTFNF